jgi:DNA-binding MarR family transcriptional regulator
MVMTHAPADPEMIAELLVHLGRLARCETGGARLTPAQWACLRFFARANDSTRTPSGFAGFQATTRGTASQIIKSLEGQGLLVRCRSEHDRRSVRFDLTDSGAAMLDQDPLGDPGDADADRGGPGPAARRARLRVVPRLRAFFRQPRARALRLHGRRPGPERDRQAVREFRSREWRRDAPRRRLT